MANAFFSMDPKILIEKLSVEIDALERPGERVPPNDSGRRPPV